MADQESCTPNASDYLSLDEAEGLFQIGGTLFTVYAVTVSIFFCVGLVGNFTFLIVLFRVQEMKTVVNVFLGNLAVTDLLYITSALIHCLLFCAPSPVHFRVSLRSSCECTISQFVLILPVFTSAGFVTILNVISLSVHLLNIE